MQFPYVSTAEAAEILGVSDGRIRQLLLAGRIVGRKANERGWLIARTEVNRFKKERQKSQRRSANGA